MEVVKQKCTCPEDGIDLDCPRHKTVDRIDFPHPDDSFFEIDQYKLDEEWTTHPKKFKLASTALAKARKELAKAEMHKDQVSAEVDRDVRTEQEAFGIAKEIRLTEGLIEKTVTLTKKYQKACLVVIEAKYEVDQRQGDVYALEHKKRGLEKMVELFAMDYYSTPTPPKGMGKELGEMEAKNFYRPKREDQ